MTNKLITHSPTSWSWDKYYIYLDEGYIHEADVYEVLYKDFGVVFQGKTLPECIEWIKEDNGDNITEEEIEEWIPSLIL